MWAIKYRYSTYSMTLCNNHLIMDEYVLYTSVACAHNNMYRGRNSISQSQVYPVQAIYGCILMKARRIPINMEDMSFRVFAI